MCGICGVFSLDGTLNPDVRASVPSMARAIAHRGPDGQGVFDDGVAALGHRRLAIIDKAGGDQPMSNEDRSCWVVFNGEIYNHRALRKDLTARGHHFRTNSDTEAILHAYEEYGTACVARLEGMFAFALYDVRRRELLLARDRLGKKPLFYAELGGALHFASEMKSMRQSPAWDPTVDLDALEGYMSLGYIMAPGTVYKRVRKLPAGHWMHVRGSSIRIQRYWDVERFDDYEGDDAALEAEVERTIDVAVRDRLESEVPLGAFLSGGIDSGLVVSFMAGAVQGSVTTTSVGFREEAHNELDAAAIMAAQFKTDHHAAIVEAEIDSAIDRVVDGFDEPFADASALPTFHVAGMAKRHATVVLSGDGGDEAFGGYSFRYAPHALEDVARRFVPGGPGRAMLRSLAAMWPRSPRVPHALRWSTLLDNVSRDPAVAYFSDLCAVKPNVARRMLGRAPLADPSGSPVFDAVTAPYLRCGSRSPVQRAQYADLKIYLTDDVLVKVDRMTMQHAVEVRCPLLDHRLIELAFRIPRHRKMPWLRSKHILRQIARRRLDRARANLPKHGFSAPVAEWFTGPLGDRFRSDVLRPGAPVADLVDRRALGVMFEDHCAGRAGHGQALWTAWMLARWCERSARHAGAALAVTGS